MAFSADELRVLRRALAEVLHPSRRAGPPAVPAVPPAPPASPAALAPAAAPRPAEYVQDCLRLVEALDEAVHESGRLRAFLLDELVRYRQALPGSAGGYLERLTAALAAGYVPRADDLAALRRLRALPCGTAENRRRTVLLRRCETLAENDVRLRLEAHMTAPRRLLTLPGLADEPAPKPGPEPAPGPARAPDEKPEPGTPDKPRTPTPAEIWPPHRRTGKPDQAARSA
ncbi:hypothetical protein SAMN05216267_104237 [Actinacidiphila rubida]|uniref:Uncharacterized protein n=2 Tax=Actinacidiphila rubida TaxID=310780 RepID=A0A1H8SH65_9ACTN|nr:hypothetical protein SAMN05216267_104237 [Actinacidiphila rubida]